jgi:hypothetical protein
MEYFAGLLILVAIALWILELYSEAPSSTASLAKPDSPQFILSVSPGGAAVLLAAVAILLLLFNPDVF